MAGADPGFSAGRGANPCGGGRGMPTYDLANFSKKKLHEMEEFFWCHEACAAGAP